MRLICRLIDVQPATAPLNSPTADHVERVEHVDARWPAGPDRDGDPQRPGAGVEDGPQDLPEAAARPRLLPRAGRVRHDGGGVAGDERQHAQHAVAVAAGQPGVERRAAVGAQAEADGGDLLTHAVAGQGAAQAQGEPAASRDRRIDADDDGRLVVDQAGAPEDVLRRVHAQAGGDDDVAERTVEPGGEGDLVPHRVHQAEDLQVRPAARRGCAPSAAGRGSRRARARSRAPGRRAERGVQSGEVALDVRPAPLRDHHDAEEGAGPARRGRRRADDDVGARPALAAPAGRRVGLSNSVTEVLLCHSECVTDVVDLAAEQGQHPAPVGPAQDDGAGVVAVAAGRHGLDPPQRLACAPRRRARARSGRRRGSCDRPGSRGRSRSAAAACFVGGMGAVRRVPHVAERVVRASRETA